MSRFIVTSVTGHPISPKGFTFSGRKPSTLWLVLDSAYCYRAVKVFTGRGTGQRRYVHDDAEARAMDLAAELNTWDAEQDGLD